MMSASNSDSETVLIPCRQDEYSERLTDIGSVYFTVENKPFRIYTVFFTGNRERLSRELKRKEGVDICQIGIDDEKTFSGLTIPCTTASGHSFVLLWMPKFGWTLEDLETLSHECIHAAVAVMRMSGVRSKIFSAEDDKSCDDEGIAYSQSSLFSSIISELVNRQNKVIRKRMCDSNPRGKSRTR